MTEDLGIDINGIIHVGTNDGYEMQWYQKMGIRHLVGVEPLPSAQKLFKARYPEIPLFTCALGDKPGKGILHVTQDDGQGSSLLRECRPNPDYRIIEDVEVEVRRWDEIALDSVQFDCLVLDVQGYEAQVLDGFGDRLQYINSINVEMSVNPVYERSVQASVLASYLEARGFDRMSKFEEHNDVFFVRRGTPMKGLRINLGSGQRPFGSGWPTGWVNVDSQARWNPDVLADMNGGLPMFPDGCAQIVVLHHVLEHVGLGELDNCIATCHRILARGGSLIVTVPNLLFLAQRWLKGEIDDYTYCVNLYGAYMGDEADRHKWGYCPRSLFKLLEPLGWSTVKTFDFREIAGSSICNDWWILGIEAVK